MGIKLRLQWRHFVPEGLLDQGGEPGPERRDGTGAADYCRGAVDHDLIAGIRVGVAGNVRHPPSGPVPRIGRDRIDGLLEGRDREQVADPSAGCPVARIIPDRFPGDGTPGGPQRSPAAPDGTGAGGREVGVRQPVADAITRAVVARGHEDRDAERGGREDGLVQRGDRLLSPPILRGSPADGENRRLVDLVMDSGRHRVDEALLGVLGEVHGDLGLRGDRPDNLDIEFDLAVRTVRIPSGRVADASDRDGHHLRDSQAQAREVGLQVSRPVAAAELEDADGLAAAVPASRKAVQPSNLPGGKAAGRADGRPEPPNGPAEPEVRPGLGPGVEPEHTGHDWTQPAWHVHRTRPGPEDAVLAGVQAQLHAECGGYPGDCAAEHDDAARRVHAHHVQAVVASEASDLFDVAGRRAETRDVLGRP